MYQNDSFYTLSTLGQVGLVLLSLMLFIALIWFIYRLSKGRKLIVRVAMALGLFYLFVWLSPQIYYTYYWLIIDNLPVQNVIKSPPSIAKIASFIFFQEKATYSNHAKGLLNLILICVAIWSGRSSGLAKRSNMKSAPDDNVYKGKL